MKKTIFAVVLVLVLTGCSGVSPYSFMDNWVIRGNAVPAYFAEFDLIYIYPSTVVNGKEKLLDWNRNGYAGEIFEFSRFQTSEVFGGKVRIFAPFVRQTGEEEYLAIASGDMKKWQDTLLAPGVNDTVNALRYYLDNYHTPGRPYILLGEGQGAVDLYYAMKECGSVTPEEGFVAAYLLNMPLLTVDMIKEDFGSRHITPAAGEYDTGVIASWNIGSQGKGAGRYIINPLNWSTSDTPVPASENKGAVFSRRGRKIFIKNFCGAAIDPAAGELRLIGGNSENLRGALGFFAENVKENAFKRVRQYLFRQQWK